MYRPCTYRRGFRLLLLSSSPVAYTGVVGGGGGRVYRKKSGFIPRWRNFVAKKCHTLEVLPESFRLCSFALRDMRPGQKEKKAVSA